MDKFTCDMCNAPMVLKDDLGKTESVRGRNKYRRRRFICSISGCGYTKMIFGNGERDEKWTTKKTT